MAAAKFFNMLLLLVFIGFVSALPGFGYGDSTPIVCSTACQTFHSRCLSGERGPEFCRDLVCEYYSNKCVGCPACVDSSAAASDFTPAVVDAGETAPAIVPRESQSNPPFCVFICYHAGCRRKCFWDPDEAPEEIHDALVINEDAVNGTVSVKITEQTADDDSKTKCKHWVCVFRTCWYVPCHNNATTEEIASVQTSETTGTSELLASGCRKVCQNDSEDAICITICDPEEYDPDEPKVDDEVNDDAFKTNKADSGYRIFDDVISYCEWKLMGHYLYQICYTKDPAKTLTPRQDVNSNNNSKGELCSTVCWDGSLCFVYCGDSSKAAGDSSKKRDGNGDVELQKAALCESNCPVTSFLCIMMCRQGPKEDGS
ncbi:hypothetical protein IQ07DRAFT_635085 [Pyrenochaeta sp. DS3sAY3a]|nr:hypothetical protein IQ07DRAFT_635085 [Pyrenochaeta sp. DS3sAY3a]